ncbi:type II secretion system protein [Duganella radicis]|uniref:Type II secretion system protein n=1 Tax=Duganella radicis TaxID=551988 RepID=A0A6L6PNL5_9BURK|nr:type II secretion system protein [Duganella radicis]MTV40563.1 type II secretion system protein [Duganella radicis]
MASVKKRHQSGFTYMALLFFVAIMGVTLAATGQLWSTAQQRIKERELLYIGGEFQRAIGAYYERTPGAIKRFPTQLDDLLTDRRMAGTVHHLRRIYLDPMTLSADWGLVQAPDGGIMGVYSHSTSTPVKTGNFADEQAGFDAAESYADWRFIYVPAKEAVPGR